MPDTNYFIERVLKEALEWCGQRQRIKVRMDMEGRKLARGKSPSLLCPLFLDVTLQSPDAVEVVED